MNVEKLQIQKAFHDLIEELQSLKDTNSAVESYRKQAVEMSERLREYLAMSDNNFEKVTAYFDNYLKATNQAVAELKKFNEMAAERENKFYGKLDGKVAEIERLTKEHVDEVLKSENRMARRFTLIEQRFNEQKHIARSTRNIALAFALVNIILAIVIIILL